ncbi:MAG: hypothetical protein OXN88_01145 [Chloroflexota bacterium]|nr:hypothetical protein [Chloroflexota bacterium]
MLDFDFVIPAHSLNIVYILLLYLPACLVCYRKLIPRLSLAAQHLLSGMLLAQALAIAVAILLPAADLWHWLWDLNREFNISSTLASTQLALVACLALAAAWLLRSRAGLRSLYLCALGLVFLFMAADEYYALHEEFLHWKRYYVAVGAALALATLVLALRSPRPARAWHVCFLIGLALAGGGAVFYEFLAVGDVDLGILRLEGSLDFSLWEEITEFLGVWLALLAAAGQFSEALPAPKAHFARLLYALPLVWLAPLYANAQIPQLELRFLAQPAAVEFERNVQLRGYRIDISEANAIHLRLYTASKRGRYSGLGYTLSLVDADSGETVASQRTRAAAHNRYWMLRPGASPIYPQSLTLAVPDGARENGAHWIVLALWREDGAGFARQKALASDQPLLDDARVILGELGGSAAASLDPPPARQ